MPMEKDTKASFQVYMQNMMQLDPNDLKWIHVGGVTLN
jgi:hypothetical protein